MTKIFTATSGRSGTGFLWAAFKEFTDFESYHEALPILKGDLLIEANQVPYPDCDALVRKAKAIATKGNYVDTAHQFMKGFYPYALAEMPDLKVIHLVRSPLKVMRSRLVRGSVPGNSHWVQSHGLRQQVLRVSSTTWERWTPFQRIAWDLLEHEERFWRVRGNFSQVVDIQFDDMIGNPVSTLAVLFDKLGVTHRIDPKKIDSLHRNSNSVPSKVHPNDHEKFEMVCNDIRKAGCSDLSWLNDHLYTTLRSYLPTSPTGGPPKGTVAEARFGVAHTENA